MIPQQGTLSPRNLEKPWPGRPCRSERQAVFGPVQPRVAIHAVQDIRRWSEGPAGGLLAVRRVGSFQATRAATAHLPMPRVPRSELRMRAEAAARPRTVFPLQSACTPAKVAGPSPKSRTLPGGIDAGIFTAHARQGLARRLSRAQIPDAPPRSWPPAPPCRFTTKRPSPRTSRPSRAFHPTPSGSTPMKTPWAPARRRWRPCVRYCPWEGAAHSGGPTYLWGQEHWPPPRACPPRTSCRLLARATRCTVPSWHSPGPAGRW